MTAPAESSAPTPPTPSPPPRLPADRAFVSPEKALRRLYLLLFLRGRGARGLRKEQAPKSVGRRLAGTLVIYALFGCIALAMVGPSIFPLSLYQHAITFMFVGMFAAASVGEVLFNREEADILLHRPVAPRELLRAKIRVLVQVSLWLAGALNLAGMIAGAVSRDSSWVYLPAHAFSASFQTMFCIGSVVLVYQLCLRWFGRERLDGLMTTAQVVMAIGAVMGGQLIPRFLPQLGQHFHLQPGIWWIWIAPPAWFAGLDEALLGHANPTARALGAIAVGSTIGLNWLVFGRLAQNYAAGLQTLNENAGQKSARAARAGRRWLDRLARTPFFRLWLRDSVTRGTFTLVAAYLVRDRDVKLRVYPGIAPMMIAPLMMMIPGRAGGDSGVFGVAFAGAYLGLVPLLGIGLLQFSQQWQASDLFRAAPLAGPAPLNRGLRRAVLVILVIPALIIYGLLALALTQEPARLALLLPGLIALPVFALLPCLKGDAVPFSRPADEAKSAGRSVQMIGALLASMVLGGIALWAWHGGWFIWLLIIELAGVLALNFALGRAAEAARWPSLD